MLGVVGSNFPDHFQTAANNTQLVATHRNMVAKRTHHVVPNDVAICSIDMLRSFGRGFKELFDLCMAPQFEPVAVFTLRIFWCHYVFFLADIFPFSLNVPAKHSTPKTESNWKNQKAHPRC